MTLSLSFLNLNGILTQSILTITQRGNVGDLNQNSLFKSLITNKAKTRNT